MVDSGPADRDAVPRQVDEGSGGARSPWSGPGATALRLSGGFVAWFVAWSVVWTVAAVRRGGASWHFFVLGGGVLGDLDDGTRAGLHVYAEHPLLQIGPLALTAAWGLLRVAGGRSLLAAQLLGAGLGVAMVLLVHRIARPVRTGKLVAASACFVPVWTYAAVSSVHLDDVLALGFGLGALALVQSGRPVWAGLAVAAAVDSKPWALPLAVLLLALAPRRTRAVGLGVAAVGVAAAWLPFFLADPRTVRALHYTIVNTALSGLRVLHVTSARTPPWDRPVQALVGAALGVAALRRGRLTGVPLLVLASRVALDPGTNRYYTAGLAAGALLWDLTGSRRRWPWWSLTVLLGLHLARWVPALDPLHGPALLVFAVAAARSVLWRSSGARHGVDAPDHGPAGPAPLLEQLQEPLRAGHELEEGRVEELDQVVAEGEGVVHALGLGRGSLDERCGAVGQLGQAGVVRTAVDHVREVAVELADLRHLDLEPLDRHESGHLVGHLRGDEDPAVPLDLDEALAEPELAQTVEVADDLRREREALPGGEPGDPFAVVLPLADLRPQAAVDLVDRRRELVVPGHEQPLHP
jgi:hypothetical protein